MNIETQAQARKAIKESRTVYLYGKASGLYLKVSKVQAYQAVKALPEYVDAWDTYAVRHSSENDLIIEV